MMKKILMGTALCLLCAGILPTEGFAQEACGTYKIKRGDSLRNIAKKAYGVEDYLRIYRENLNEIGRDPNIINVGVVLRLPCADGALPATTDEAEEAPATDWAANPDVGNNPAVVSFVAANDYKPYTDESLPGQGLITSLITHAMLRANPEQEVEIIFVNDRAAHLDALLPTLAFDASFPWSRPGCESQGTLTKTEGYACQYYNYSDPIYEIVEGFFTRNGSAYEGAVVNGDLSGAKVCRPEGYPTSHLELAGLMPPTINLVQPTGVTGCFEQLMTGSVDVVALDTRTGEQAMTELGLQNSVTSNPNLVTIVPMQVAVHKANPEGQNLIDTLNLGLQVMLVSGEWHDIIASGLRTQIMPATN